MKPVFIIAIVFSITIALVGGVAMTNTANAELFDINRPVTLTQFAQQISENAADKAVEANKAIAEAKRIEVVAERDVAKAKSKYNAAIAEYKAAEEARSYIDPRIIKYNEAMAKSIAIGESKSGKSAEQAEYNKYKVVVDKVAADAKRIEVAGAKLAEAKVVAEKAEDVAYKAAIAVKAAYKVAAEYQGMIAADKVVVSKVVVSKAVEIKASTEDRVMIAEAKAIADKAESKAVEVESEYNAALSEYTIIGGKAGTDAKRIEVAGAKLAEAKVVAYKARDAADKAAIAVKTAENIALYNAYKVDGAAQAPTRDYGSSAYNTPQAPSTNYGSSEQYVPQGYDMGPPLVTPPRVELPKVDRSVITDHKLDIPKFNPNPIPKYTPPPPSNNPAKQFDIPNPGRDIVLSRENPGIPSSAWNNP